MLRCLLHLKAVEGPVEVAGHGGPSFSISFWLLRVHGLLRGLQIAVEEGSFDVNLVKLRIGCCCQCQDLLQGTQVGVLADRCEVYTVKTLFQSMPSVCMKPLVQTPSLALYCPAMTQASCLNLKSTWPCARLTPVG